MFNPATIAPFVCQCGQFLYNTAQCCKQVSQVTPSLAAYHDLRASLDKQQHMLDVFGDDLDALIGCVCFTHQACHWTTKWCCVYQDAHAFEHRATNCRQERNHKFRMHLRVAMADTL